MFWHMPTAEKAAEKICSKCKESTASSGDAWCKECRAKYQQEYRSMLEWRTERRGIIRGILAMREHIATHFLQWGGRPFMGNEIASVVSTLPGPAVADEKA